MDGFQQTFVQTLKSADRCKRSADRLKRANWARAMKRFEHSLAAIKPAMDEHAAFERTMFAARRKLEALTLPSALTVPIDVEMYFNDGMHPPLLRRSRQTADLKDEASILAFAKGDEATKAKLLDVLRAYEAKRAPLVIAYEQAKARSDASYDQSAAVIDHSDIQLLRVFRTPAPGLSELYWKIEILRREDCSGHAEEQGWIYVLEELAAFTKQGVTA